MGTSGAYSGSGGKDGKAVRDTVSDYLDGMSGQGSDGRNGDRPPLDPSALQRVINLIRPRSTSGGGDDGPGGGGGGGTSGSGGGRGSGGPQRTVAGSARTAGRAAAAAYAYSTGDAATLQRLGLDYDELRGLGDDIEVMRRIVDIENSGNTYVEAHDRKQSTDTASSRSRNSNDPSRLRMTSPMYAAS